MIYLSNLMFPNGNIAARLVRIGEITGSTLEIVRLYRAQAASGRICSLIATTYRIGKRMSRNQNSPEDNSVIKQLEKFDFTSMEAKVYVTLVASGPMNGSRIAKHLNASRSSVYSALNNLFARGAVFMIAGEPTEYSAESPDVLIDRLEKEYLSAIAELRDEIRKTAMDSHAEHYWNVSGEDTCIRKARDLIEGARKEILLHTNTGLAPFEDSIRQAVKRGVRIISFGFVTPDVPDLPIEQFYDPKFDFGKTLDRRIMLVCDLRTVLIAGGYHGGTFLGTFSHNPLLVGLVSEHIHHDIYLYKLEQKFGKDLVDPSVQIQSLQEQAFKRWADEVKSSGSEPPTT